jgi:hypothetical protein
MKTMMEAIAGAPTYEFPSNCWVCNIAKPLLQLLLQMPSQKVS